MVEAASNVSNPDFPVAPGSASPKLGQGNGNRAFDESLGTCELQCSIAAVGEKVEGKKITSLSDMRGHRLGKPGRSCPITRGDGVVGQLVECKRIVRVAVKRGFK